MSEAIFIQRATLQDAPDIIALLDTLLHEVMHSSGQASAFSFDTDQALQTLQTFFAQETYYAYLARSSNGIPLGCITMEESRALYAGGVFGTLREFFVRPEFRSRNIGQLLLEAAKTFGHARAWARLEVTTPPLPQFDRTLAFYERHGFSITGGRKLKVTL